MQPASYDDAYLKDLFDRMGPTYDIVNFVSSFGFAEWWRRECVRNAGISSGARVCDMMAGSGECWKYVARRGGSLVSVDFSPVMVQRQIRRNRRFGSRVDVRCENALQSSIEDESIDCLVSSFGLKTLNEPGITRFAKEIRRVLKPGAHLIF